MTEVIELEQIKDVEIPFPEDLEFLLTEPARFKILYGGRGGAKTESIGLALIILSRLKTLRIACFREIQKSISESVYATIENRIRDLGIAEEFDFVDKEIRHKITGSVFIFYGLRYNINSIKSLARIDIAWVEEAVNVSKTSWDKLEPTIRGKHIDDPTGMGGPFGEGPEIWASFNPELDSDHTYERFILHRDKYAPDFIEEDGRQVRYAYVKKINLEDNPFAPRDLIRQATLLKEKDELEYMHVYGGHTKQVLDGAIYAEEIKQVLSEGRRGEVRYDPSRAVHTFWDLGHSDQTAIWFVQHSGVHFNLIDYYQDSLKKLPFYVEQLQERKYNYGFHYLPHDGDNETLAARSPARILRDTYPGKVKIVPRIPKKIVGIRAARVVFELCNFDELKTAEGWTCLCKYQYAVDENGKMSKDPLHNEYSNGCFTGDTKILTREGPKAINTLAEIGEVWTQFGWQIYQNPHLTRKNAPLVEVCFTNGYTVKCTPDHLFLTESGWKSAENLQKGFVIQSGLQTPSNISTEKFIEYTNRTIIFKAVNLYTAMFGKKRLEQYQKLAIYIIRMKINTTINSGIWNVCQWVNTYPIAVNVNMKKAGIGKFQNTLELKRQNGIPPKMESVGTVRTLVKLNLGKDGKEKHSTVLYVKHLFKQLIEKIAGENIVQSNVDILSIKSVRRLTETSDVYCLTVPSCGHFALANGAIVKNCDAFQTFALSLKTETATKVKDNSEQIAKIINIRPSINSWMST